MFWMDFLIVLTIALLIASAFGMGRRRYSAGLDLVMFFLLLFLATWALGGWLRPVGPVLWGTYWVPYIFVALLIALLLAAALAAPNGRVPRTRTEQREEAQAEAPVAVAFGMFFWIFLIVAVVAIAASYLL